MEKRIKKIWVAGLFLPAVNATVFRVFKVVVGYNAQLKQALMLSLNESRMF